ncbi:hypothetical protein CDAR_611651 [Caerostris darwini]|uniref:Uncharacterized protein n=1 Tax=Caerostris darwini TaxID=1538125 RepID=A0AAV4U2U9_9ARAC|nr:hypothetical protein CDAR_611651 [Caerostris darwini]
MASNSELCSQKRSERNVRNNLTRGNPKPLESPFKGKQGTNESLCGIKEIPKGNIKSSKRIGRTVSSAGVHVWIHCCETDPAHSIRIDYKWSTTLTSSAKQEGVGGEAHSCSSRKTTSNLREHD